MTYITTGARRVETFAGMFAHQASGLYLTMYRAYDPYSARWLSRDPAGEFSDVLADASWTSRSKSRFLTNANTAIAPFEGLTLQNYQSSTTVAIAADQFPFVAKSVFLYGYVDGDSIDNVDRLGLFNLAQGIGQGIAGGFAGYCSVKPWQPNSPSGAYEAGLGAFIGFISGLLGF